MTCRTFSLVSAAFMLAGQAALAETTMIFVERASTDAVSVHAGKAADNAGDILTFTNDVYDAGNETKLGYDQGYCVRMVVANPGNATGRWWLAQGQISVDGPFLDAGDTTLAVTGGTGTYMGASGEMKLHARDAKGTAYDFTYRLK